MRNLPIEVWKLTIAYSLMLCGTSLIVLVAGIIGDAIAPSKQLATLPVALMIVGLALSTVFIALMMQRYGRKKVFVVFAVLSIASALLAAYAIHKNHFVLFCFAATAIGMSSAAVQQYRFAAIQWVDTQTIPVAVSAVLLGGIIAAIIGPELSTLGRNLFAVEFVGSFILLSQVYLAGLLLLLIIKEKNAGISHSGEKGRPLRQLLGQPMLLIAILSAASAYAVMSYVMTATPLSMHNHFQHSLESTKWVIQSHIVAMYLPSLFSGSLIRWFGHRLMMNIGLLAYLLCFVIAYLNQGFWGFWLALIFLGVGWNFLFVAATALLPLCYRPKEQYKVQAVNDLTVFSTQAMGALTSGWVLFNYQWQGLLLTAAIPIVLILFLLLFRHDLSRQHDLG